MPTPTLLRRLKERKLVQWAFAYLAGAWVVLQALDALETPLGLTATIQRAVLVVVVAGFFVTLVLAWYHGEKGRQRVSGPELLMVAALLVVAGAALSAVGGGDGATLPPDVSVEEEAGDDRPSIAILPFENLSPDPENAFFADGMQEEITAKLSTLSALRVISRSSVMQYREERPSSPQIAEELGVDFLVEGSARVGGGQVRLTVQLIDAVSDEHSWAESYNLNLNAEDLFEVEGDVARQIAFQIGLNLTPTERESVGKVLTENTDAYLLFMQGTEAFTEERVWGRVGNNLRSVRLLDQALELDPGFALARARLALSLTYGYSENMERARREAETALSVLPRLSEARLALGRYFGYLGESDEAIRHLRAAEAESPNMPLVAQQIASHQQHSGDFSAGFRMLKRAEALDPRNPIVQTELARSLTFAHRYDEALEANSIREEVLPTYAGIRWRLWTNFLKGDTMEARAAVSELLDTDAWGFYNFNLSAPYEAVRRVMTPEEGRAAFASYLDYWSQPLGPCPDVPAVCIRRALHEEELGSKERAKIHWDSLRVYADTVSEGNRPEYPVHIYMGLGERDAAVRVAEEISADSEDWYMRRPLSKRLLAQVYTRFDEHDRAIDLLEEILPAPSWLSVPLLEIDPIWDPLRDHPRFQALLERYRDEVGY